MMDITHPQMVTKLVKPGRDILGEISIKNTFILLTAAKMLVADGVHLDLAKKQAIYNKDMDMPYQSGSAFDIPTITAEKMHLLHMAVGVVGEACELLEAVLAHIEGAPLDRENVIEELGDIEFYSEGCRQGIDVSRQEVCDANMAKLAIRYGGFNYSNEAAQQRADKA